MKTGATIVSVLTPDEHVTAVGGILERHNPIDIDERKSTYGSAAFAPATTTGTAIATTGTATGLADGRIATPATGVTLQPAEEKLVVGKRLVNHGTTRVLRFVVETPVEEQVTLHDEKIIVDRKSIAEGRAGGDEAFTDKAIEMTETGEEAVVGKTARLHEEVHLRKKAVDRVETVRDTVRLEDVAIEKVPGAVPVERKI
nr:YsnF/AvaK domain-containing protein [uncultured Lichenicoccus sp.]